MLGVHLCCEAALRHGVSRIVITGSGASYLPGASDTGYTSSKAAVCRYAETLNNKLDLPVFLFSPGLVRTEMTASFADDETLDAARMRTEPRPQAGNRPLRRPRRPLPAR